MISRVPFDGIAPVAGAVPAASALLATGTMLAAQERRTPREALHSVLHAKAAGALNVLIVEDDDSVREVCAEIATSQGCHVSTADSVPAARTLLGRATPDVVFLDMRLPGGSGSSLLDEIRTAHPGVFVVIMTAYATVTSAVEMMRSGAGDFLPKPFALDQVTAALERAVERRQWADLNRSLHDRLQAGVGAGRLIGRSVAMQKLLRIVSKVAFTRHPVLLLGERGSGKEVVARAIHANGPQGTHPFIPVDCDAIAASRLEAELFGSEAPDGRQRAGLLASAVDGTVYLAEIDTLDSTLQVKLLRALQDKHVRPVNSDVAVPFAARVLASSSRNLEVLVEEGRFRKDLFYRLNVVNIRVPALRDRPEDLPLLAEHFLEGQRRERETPFLFSEQALTSMLGYPWPGNVEELESMIEHACAFSSGPVIHFDDMSSQVKAFATAVTVPEPPTASAALVSAPVTLRTLQEMEKQAIEDALKLLGGDKVLAARCLGIGKTTLYRKLKEYDLGHA